MEPQLMHQETAATDEDSAPPPPDAAVARQKARVLVVEDDADMRRLVALVLRREGYHVIEADDGLGLLECLQSTIWNRRKEPIDAIVSDIQMPDLSALEVLQALPGRQADTPVVLMTAYGADQARGEARRLGAVAVLDKPLDWQKFRLAVQHAVSMRRTAHEIAATGPRRISLSPLATARPRQLS